MVREGLTERLDEVTEAVETKYREVRTHIETVKVALEDEIEETHREIKEVRQKLEDVEEGVSEIKKRRRETTKEIKEEVMEYVQGRCSNRDGVLTNQIKSLQVAEKVRRRGAKVSGGILGNVYGVRGDSVGLGVGLDPGVRERLLVKCATGTECEGGSVRGGPTMGCVRKKCAPRSECAVESELVVARVRGGTWKRVVGSVTEDVTKECTPVVSVTEGVTGKCAQEDARERCVTAECMRTERAVESKGECANECGGESSESDMERELGVAGERECTPGMEGCTPGMVERVWECTLELVVRHVIGCASECTPVVVTGDVTEEWARRGVLVRCTNDECVPRCAVVRCVTKSMSGMSVPGCLREGAMTRSMGTAGCMSKERNAGCEHASGASTLNGIAVKSTFSRSGPSVRAGRCVPREPGGIVTTAVWKEPPYTIHAGPRSERPRPCSTKRSGRPGSRTPRKGRHGDPFLLRRSGRARSGHWTAPC
uniref:uncharacterized protein n=1 Tax=Myxine glutinosa TaxID=7769 RepID=UPI00358E5A5A